MNTYPRTPCLAPGIGVFPDIAPTDYFRWACLDYSTLTRIGEWDQPGNTILPAPGRSPAHAIDYLRGEPAPPTEAQVFGSKFHSLLLEPRRFMDCYHVQTDKIDRRTAAGKAGWAALTATYPPERIVTADEVADIRLMAEGAARNAQAKLLIRAVGECEVSMVWDDAETGVRLKGRLDKLIRGENGEAVVVDVKTTQCAHPRKFCYDAARYGYHVQAALYHDAVVALLGVEPAYYLIAVEKSRVAPTVVYQARPEEVAAGRTVYRALIREFVACEQSGLWPAYEDRHVVPLTLPEWAMAERDEETDGIPIEPSVAAA